MISFSTIEDIKTIIENTIKNKQTLSVVVTMNADKFVLTSNTTNHVCVLNNMKRIIEINTNNEYVIVDSGITWVSLLEELDKINYTLYTTQSGLTFSVGGSFCGNAHGRKTFIPMVKDTILEFTFIDSTGDLHTVDNRSDIFYAFPGSLGLLGIILQLKIKIRKRYNVCASHTIIPYSEQSIDYVFSRTQDPSVCMINVQMSYFNDIKEMILVEHTYGDGLVKDEYDKQKYTADSSIYYTFCIVLLVILSTFTFLNSTRWNLEKSVSKSAINTDCININNSFDNWSKPFYPNFKII